MKEYSGEKIVKAKHILQVQLGELSKLLQMEFSYFRIEG